MFTKSLTTENLIRWRDRHIERLRSGQYLKYYPLRIVKIENPFMRIGDLLCRRTITGMGILDEVWYDRHDTLISDEHGQSGKIAKLAPHWCVFSIKSKSGN